MQGSMLGKCWGVAKRYDMLQVPLLILLIHYMKNFEIERQDIIKSYTLSPRCVKSRARPTEPMYSWKNYLNPDINRLSHQVRKSEILAPQPQKYVRYNHAFSQTGSLKSEGMNVQAMDQYYLQTQNGENEKPETNRNCYSKVEIQANQIEKHRYSNSTIIGGPQRGKQAPANTPTTTEADLSSKLQKQEAQFYALSDTVKMEHMGMYSSAAKNIDQVSWDNMRTNRKTIDSLRLSQEQADIDLYHQKLKEEERLYLLDKFMKHYEQIHGKKL